ncbi:unnamed protein product [Bemisia tabaci]|uniref:Uncharacterized protein n=1 Tax=Bemisia tabaci TaxID=7038 RepID=A0A9P0ANX8_BEMTA|nr:unnamed protein product [Bemisia tabaci]
MRCSHCFEWVKRFKTGQEFVKDEEHGNRPSTATDICHVEEVRAKVLENGHFELFEQSNISEGSVRTILIEYVDTHRVSEPTTRQECLRECHNKHGHVLYKSLGVSPMLDGRFGDKKCECVMHVNLMDAVEKITGKATEFKELFENNSEEGMKWLIAHGFRVVHKNLQPRVQHSHSNTGNHSSDNTGKHSSRRTEKHSSSKTGRHSSSKTEKYSSSTTEKHSPVFYSSSNTEKPPPSSSTPSEVEEKQRAKAQCRSECHQTHGYVFFAGWYPITDGQLQGTECHCVISQPLIEVLEQLGHNKGQETWAVDLKNVSEKNPEEGKKWLENQGFKTCTTNPYPSGCHSPDSTRKHSSSTTGKHSSSNNGNHSSSKTKKHLKFRLPFFTSSSPSSPPSPPKKEDSRQSNCKEECHQKHGHWHIPHGSYSFPIMDGHLRDGKCECIIFHPFIAFLVKLGRENEHGTWAIDFETLFKKNPEEGMKWLEEKGFKRCATTYEECRAECHEKHGWVNIGVAAPILEGDFKDKKCKCVISPSLIRYLGERNFDPTKFTDLFKINPEEGMKWLEEKSFERCDANSDPSGCHSPDSPRNHSARTTGKHASPDQEPDASTSSRKRELVRTTGFKRSGQ